MPAIPVSSTNSGSVTKACGGCHLADRCDAATPRARGPLEGTGLVLASLLHFLLPAALALAGAAVGSGSSLRQLSGGLAGLILGMLIAALAARRQSAALDGENCFEPR